MNTQERVVNVKPRRGVIRRVGAAVTGLLALFVLAGCHQACGYGSIDEPADVADLPVDFPIDNLPGVPNGKANFSFTYHCDPNQVNGRVYTYTDTSTNGLYTGLKLKGVVTNTLIEAGDGDDELEQATSCQDVMEAPVAQFEGTYWSLEKKYCYAPKGRFRILAFDQGNPSLPAGEFTGDGFAIDLEGGPYNLYTRAGYIESGDIYAA